MSVLIISTVYLQTGYFCYINQEKENDNGHVDIDKLPNIEISVIMINGFSFLIFH
jgi:hypothetical protein